MIANVQRVIKNLKEISFMQPIYEAVNNALEASASEIKVHFHTTTTMFSEKEVKKYVIGVTVEDNGEGFSKDNIISFCEYLTDKKAALGCKGIGRFTWLKVFQYALISSEIKEPQGHSSIQFKFDANFTDILPSQLEKKRVFDDKPLTENKTLIQLENISKKYFDVSRKEQCVPEANLFELTEHIRLHLLPNLILRKQAGKKFTIVLTMDDSDDSQIISNTSIVELQKKEFLVDVEIGDSKEQVPFNLFMSITKDGKGRSDNYFCAHNRTVTKFEDEGIKITVPNQDSSVFLLTSTYLDDRVNQERNGFDNIKPRSSDLASPLSWEGIKRPLITNIADEIDKLYPDMKKWNATTLEHLVQEHPHLAKYLRNEEKNLGVLNTEEILKRSKKHYEDDKDRIEKNFLQALERNKVDSASFKEAISDIQEMSTFELARYVMYRQNIIKALKKISEETEGKEEKLHSLFMQMIKSAKSGNYLDSNLWLFDDKYMTYDYVASDCSIKRIFEEMKQESPRSFGGREPDLVIFYSTSQEKERKDLVVVEFKKPQATRQEKDISITEITNNVAIFKRHIPNLGQVWNYIVTTIDDSFMETLRNQDFQPLFAPGKDKERIFYKYYRNLEAHCYAVSIEAIIHNSNLRNKTFLNILTGKELGHNEKI